MHIPIDKSRKICGTAFRYIHYVKGDATMHIVSALADIICKTLLDPALLAKARRRPGAFTRNNGKLPYWAIMKLLLKNSSLSISAMLDEFFIELQKQIQSSRIRTMHCTQQAFSKARSGIDHSLFKACFYRVLDFLCAKESHSFSKRLGGQWGVQVIAIDGSKIELPNRKCLLERYGGAGKGATSPTAIASIAYDVLNERILDAQLEPLHIGERVLAIRHMNNIRNSHRTDLLYTMFVFDRGYASKELILFIENDLHSRYLFRVRDKFNLLIDALPGPQTPDGIADHDISLYGNARIRVLKFFLPSGIMETLITNDFDMDAGLFRHTYFLRWPVEETYKLIKEKVGLTNFKGWCENSIKQEFWISMLLANLAHVIKKETDGIIQYEQPLRKEVLKHSYQTNMNELVGGISRRFGLYMDAYLEDASPFEKAQIIEDLCRFAIHHRVINKKGTGESSPRDKPRNVKWHANVKLTH